MDEQNQNGMNDGGMENNAPMGGDNSTNVHVEGEGGGRNPIATIAIILLVALLGYGVYAYLSRDNGSVEEPTDEDMEMEMEQMNEEEIMGDLELEMQAEGPTTTEEPAAE